jgi:hypothetical protein
VKQNRRTRRGLFSAKDLRGALKLAEPPNKKTVEVDYVDPPDIEA